MRYSIFILATFLLFSCKKQIIAEPVFSEARYSIEITGKWKGPEFGVPPGVHFTPVYGMVHNRDGSMWKENTLASPGVETVAESGNAYPLLTEIDSIIGTGKAISIIVIPTPAPTGSSSTNVYCNSNYSYISLETMLAPTPDWFTGISGFNLCRDNKWIVDTILHLYAWDAGTEDGDVFSYNNPATDPRQPIRQLTPGNAMVLANGNPQLAPIASLRFKRQ